MKLNKKLVFKNINPRIAAISFFLVGSLMVWNWQNNDQPAPSRFLVQLPPKPETILQNRDLSIYDFGGRIDDTINQFEISDKSRELSKKDARAFIFKHWQEKKRAYLVLEFGGVDNFSEFHVFIEPSETGEWQIVWRTELSDFGRGFSSGISSEISTSVKYETAGKESSGYEAGTKYLIFLDRNGKEVGSL